MESIQVQTTQNITLDYELAGVGDRLIATIIDVMIQVGYALIMMLLQGSLSNIGLEFGTTTMVIVYLPVFLYEVLLESMLNGQTFGKHIRNIRVIQIDGTEATIGSFIIRWLFRLIEITGSLGSIALLTLLINGRGQRLGDMAARTTVIRTKKRMRLEDTILTKVEDDYRPVFREAVNLSDKDIEIIMDVLKAKPEEDKHGIMKIEFIKKTAVIIKKKLALESDMDSRQFLNTIVKDFNYLKGKLT